MERIERNKRMLGLHIGDGRHHLEIITTPDDLISMDFEDVAVLTIFKK
jgi:hypothetical protein